MSTTGNEKIKVTFGCCCSNQIEIKKKLLAKKKRENEITDSLEDKQKQDTTCPDWTCKGKLAPSFFFSNMRVKEKTCMCFFFKQYILPPKETDEALLLSERCHYINTKPSFLTAATSHVK